MAIYRRRSNCSLKRAMGVEVMPRIKEGYNLILAPQADDKASLKALRQFHETTLQLLEQQAGSFIGKASLRSNKRGSQEVPVAEGVVVTRSKKRAS